MDLIGQTVAKSVWDIQSSPVAAAYPMVQRAILPTLFGPDDAPDIRFRVNDHDRGFGYLTGALPLPPGSKPFANAVAWMLSVAASDRPADHIDPSPPIAFVVGMATETGRSEILLADSAVGEWPFRVFPIEGPNIEVLYSATPMGKMPGTALAKAKHHQSIPVAIARIGTPAEQVLKVMDGDSGKFTKMMRFNRFPRTLRYHVYRALLVFGHDSLPTGD